MARLQLINHGSPAMLCVVSNVLMPDGTKRIYSETGRNAFSHICERIRLDQAFIRERQSSQRMRS